MESISEVEGLAAAAAAVGSCGVVWATTKNKSSSSLCKMDWLVRLSINERARLQKNGCGEMCNEVKAGNPPGTLAACSDVWNKTYFNWNGPNVLTNKGKGKYSGGHLIVMSQRDSNQHLLGYSKIHYYLIILAFFFSVLVLVNIPFLLYGGWSRMCVMGHLIQSFLALTGLNWQTTLIRNHYST